MNSATISQLLSLTLASLCVNLAEADSRTLSQHDGLVRLALCIVSSTRSINDFIITSSKPPGEPTNERIEISLTDQSDPKGVKSYRVFSVESSDDGIKIQPAKYGLKLDENLNTKPEIN